MTILNQGYVRDLNLDETFDGARSLDNLALGSISQDLSIFANNTGNVSTVVWKKDQPNYSIQDNKTFYFDTEILYGDGDPINILPCLIIESVSFSSGLLTLVFSKPHNLLKDSDIVVQKTRFTLAGGNVNGTYQVASVVSSTSVRINVPEIADEDLGDYVTSSKGYVTSTKLTLPSPLATNIRYFVSLSNATNRFDVTLSYQQKVLPVSVILAGNVETDLLFVRSNTVTTENILNLALPEIEDENFNYVGQGNTFEENFSTVENQLDGANFIRSKKLRRNDDNTFDSEIKLEGHLRIIDPDNFNDGTVKLNPEVYPKTPGVFIVSPASTVNNILKIRAFSDSSNPWEINTTTDDLETFSTQINIGDLNLVSQSISTGGNGTEGSGSPTLISIQNITNASNTSDLSFTHKLPVEINGEIYYLLLRIAQ